MAHRACVVVVIVSVFLAVSVAFTVILTVRIRRLRGERESAVVQAREDLARDVHDLVSHWLWLASVKSELAYRRAGGDARLRRELGEAVDAVKHAAHAVREVATAGLAGPLVHVHDEIGRARALLRTLGVECRADVAEDPLTPAVSVALGTVVREGVTNLLRHSTATTCVIVLARRKDRIRLTMANDGAKAAAGTGPDAGADVGTDDEGDGGAGQGLGGEPGAGSAAGGAGGSARGGTGIGNLRHRIEPLGGAVYGIRGAAGTDGWFTLVTEVPLPEARRDS